MGTCPGSIFLPLAPLLPWLLAPMASYLTRATLAHAGCPAAPRRCCLIDFCKTLIHAACHSLPCSKTISVPTATGFKLKSSLGIPSWPQSTFQSHSSLLSCTNLLSGQTKKNQPCVEGHFMPWAGCGLLVEYKNTGTLSLPSRMYNLSKNKACVKSLLTTQESMNTSCEGNVTSR